MTFVLDMNEPDVQERTTLPEGMYEVYISKAEFIATSTGGRAFLLIGEVEYNGFEYRIRERFNTKNASADAEAMGRTRLRELMFACLGKDTEIQKPSEQEIEQIVLNRTVLVHIKHRPGFPDKTKIDYNPVNFWSLKRENRQGRKIPITSGEDLPF